MVVRWTYAEHARHESLGGFGGDLVRGLNIGPLTGWRWHLECAIWYLTTNCKIVAPISTVQCGTLEAGALGTVRGSKVNLQSLR